MKKTPIWADLGGEKAIMMFKIQEYEDLECEILGIDRNLTFNNLAIGMIKSKYMHDWC